MSTTARVALITGCGKPSGIGAATARALAAAGISVVVSDIEAKGLSDSHNQQGDIDSSWGGLGSLIHEIEKSGGTASSTLGDVSVEADAKRMVDEVIAKYGRLDILVSNAAAPQGADRNEIEDVPVEAWDKVMAVNARGAFLMARAATPIMRKAKWGRIIVVSSAQAYRPRPKRFTYGASKAALIGFAKNLSIDLAPFGITVNAVCPGPVRTSRAYSTMRREISADNIEKAFAARASIVPIGRHAQPEEIAALIAFIASDGSSYITGQAIGVNGGSAGSL